MEQIKNFFKKDHFAAHNGIEIVKISPGKAKSRMQVEEQHLNGVNTVHGGALFTLAVFTFA